MKDRDQQGRFRPETTDEDVLAAVRTHEPAATSDVADELGVSRQAADYRLRSLRDEGRVNSKKIGASLVWFAPDAAGGRDRDDDVEDTRDRVDPGTDRDHREDGRDECHRTDENGVLDDVEFPATCERAECEAAVYAARDYIHDHGSATKRDLVKNVMPEHPVGYDADAALAKLEDENARYRGSWWRKVIKPGLQAFDDVAPPPQGASAWRDTSDV